MGQGARYHGGDLRRDDARARHHRESFTLQIRHHAAQASVAQLGLQWQPTQRVHRVIQIQQQLAPLHGAHVVDQLGRQTGGIEQRRKLFAHGAARNTQAARRGTMHVVGLIQYNVVRHHPGKRRQVRRCGLDAGQVVHTVLQRHDGGARFAELRNILRCGQRGTAFDAEQNHAGFSIESKVSQRSRQPHRRSCQMSVEAIKVRYGQPILRKRLHQAGPSDKADLLPTQRQTPAHIAANGACAHDDEIHRAMLQDITTGHYYKT